MLTSQSVLIALDSGVQLLGQKQGRCAVQTHELRECGVIFRFGSGAYICGLCGVIRHGGHQFCQALAGFGIRVLTEPIMGDLGGGSIQIEAAQLVGAGVVAAHTVDLHDPVILQTDEFMACFQQGLTDGIAVGIRNIFRSDDQLTAGLHHQNKAAFLQCRHAGQHPQHHGQYQKEAQNFFHFHVLPPRIGRGHISSRAS